MALSFEVHRSFLKCFRGGIKHKNLKPKVVDAFENQVKVIFNLTLFHCLCNTPQKVFILDNE